MVPSPLRLLIVGSNPTLATNFKRIKMKKYLLSLMVLVVILTSCSTQQHGYNYKKHSNTQQKMYKQTKRVNKGKNQLNHQCTPKKHR